MEGDAGTQWIRHWTNGAIPKRNRGGRMMNIWLEHFRRNLTIVGFRDVQIRKPDELLHEVKERIGEIHVQFFDASLVAGFDHLRFAALNALNAFKSKVNVSNSLAMETLLCASARRQIKEALNLVGIKPDTRRVVVLILTVSRKQASGVVGIVSELIGGKRDDSVVEFTEDKMSELMKMFDVSKVELEAKTERKSGRKQALMDLIIEHMALLVTQR
jgi:tRNA threonylcarbamoyladenosine modification (KEOPS) complex Cgi121 subunit